MYSRIRVMPKACICTVIKNEHEYLDEWIKYHLNLGICHIFVFEDLDSDTHKEITKKYDRVSLHSINDVLNDDDRRTAITLKRTKQYNAQHMYFRSALDYIKGLSLYDWCFVMDADEFITLENTSDELNHVLSLYSDYDALVLRWKCYGANGLIEKPDYSVHGVIDTYTKEMTGLVPDSPDSFTKTCHNLNRYKGENFFNQHRPAEDCNYVNTAFEKDRTVPCYKNMFIRHYITKSWEEYAWKMNRRCFVWGGRRDFDFFFFINPELKHMKQTLIDSIKQEKLVLLQYKQYGSQGNEIKLALQAWRKYCMFDYHFVVIGQFNDSIKEGFDWVEFIHCDPKERVPNQYNQHLDFQYEMEYIWKRFGKAYDGFIWVADDNYAIKPFTLDDILTVHYHCLSFSGSPNTPASFWSHDKWKTRQLLDKEKRPHINYTTHFPCYFEFNKLKELWDKFNMRNESYVIEDVYFNYFEHEPPVLDDSIRLGVWDSHIFEYDFNNAVGNPNIKFVCNSIEGWSKKLEESIKQIIES